MPTLKDALLEICQKETSRRFYFTFDQAESEARKELVHEIKDTCEQNWQDEDTFIFQLVDCLARRFYVPRMTKREREREGSLLSAH